MSPLPRLWGTAVSHYQVEGDDLCDWSEWERAGRTRGGACGRAVDSWTRYEEDADLARDAGANAFRFSVSWSRVEPKPGQFDDRALARYRRLIDHLNAVGVEPVVTLFHYTHPLWFHDRAPWTSPKSVEAFARFARYVAGAFGDSVRVWIPLNEPLVFLLAAFYDAQIPPGIANGRLLPKVLDHLLAAHCEAAAAIRERAPDASIGIAHNMVAFAPERPDSFLDRLLTRIAHRCYNRGIIEAFASGRWDFLLPPTTRVRGRRDDLVRSLDFFGVNFYSRLHLRCPGKERFVGEFRYADRSGRGLTDNGWEIVPDALESLLGEASAIGLPLLISENGVADAEDHVRGAFIADHAAAIERAEERGIPVAGYLYWSLVDNYEWLEGFGPKFGLYEVDRLTMARRPRPSVATFRTSGRDFLRRPHARRSGAAGPGSL
ncbi:MAG TPA: family 1 glycosylhydrolase [Thermoanaerobaculia bacterium]|nr:family 1 glycosylhydrolase [Thermoanaerobaculia bacterium]